MIGELSEFGRSDRCVSEIRHERHFRTGRREEDRVRPPLLRRSQSKGRRRGGNLMSNTVLHAVKVPSFGLAVKMAHAFDLATTA
jgi:hypothetical protein